VRSTAARAAVDLTPVGHRWRADLQSQLSAVLRDQHQDTGTLDPLLEATAAARAAADATGAGHPDGAGHLTNLTAVLGTLFDRTGDAEALSGAVDAARVAVAATPAGHPSRAGRLSNLGAVLRILFDQNADAATLDEAVAAGRAAVEATPEGHPARPGRQFNLSQVLQTLYDTTGDPAALAGALAAARAAVDGTADTHPDRPYYLLGLGIAVHAGYDRDGSAEALAEERELLAEAMDSPVAAVSVRITAGRAKSRADAAAADPEAALAAMDTVVGLLPLAAARTLRRADREYRLGEAAGIGAQAAAAALGAGRPDRAVELLEQARGLLLGEVMESRAETARLREHAPDLVDEFELALERLAAADAVQPFEADDMRPMARRDSAVAWAKRRQDANRLAAQRSEAVAEWNALIGRIRDRTDLEDFLIPSPAGRLAGHAAGGPIVVISADLGRCDALILRSGSAGSGVTHVPLPRLTLATATEQADRWRAAFQTARGGGVGYAALLAAHRELQEILGWLWDTTTGPILDALGEGVVPAGAEAGGEPRLWWCPVGVMARLPLHAAGHHDEAGRGDEARLGDDGGPGVPGPRTVLDRVVSSYTSTIRALGFVHRSARHDQPAPAAGAALIVAMPTTPGAKPLERVEDEVDRLRDLLPGALVLREAEATHDAVVEVLPAHSVAHFACHGVSDMDDPGASRLLLQDHASRPLTVRAMSRDKLIDGGLAYLSACSTTDTSLRLVDEAVHVTAAFQFAGYRHVIGTYWPVEDDAATRVAVEFYSQLTDEGRRPPESAHAARALHAAIRGLRADFPSVPTRWTAHLHMGA
jgi:hypothetical protein